LRSRRALHTNSTCPLILRENNWLVPTIPCYTEVFHLFIDCAFRPPYKISDVLFWLYISLTYLDEA
jgi:hypothetical protein